MEENPKSIALPRVCPRPTRYKKSPEMTWSKSRCLDANDVLVVDDDCNEAACRRLSSRGSSRRPIRPPKPSGSANRKTPKRLAENDDARWRVASAKSTRGNRSIAASCEPIKTASVPYPVTSHYGPTRTETTTTTPLPTRRDCPLSHPSRHCGRQGHCDRGGEWGGRVGGQERIGCSHAQETTTDPRAAGGQPARGRQHASSMARVGRPVTL